MTDRSGFTIIEVVIALTLLSVVMVGFVSMTGKTVHIAATSDRQESAIQLVNDRLDQVRADPNYGALDTTYAKTESSFPTLPGFTRTTVINDCKVTGNGQGNCKGNGQDDFKEITVTVTGPGISTPVGRTVTVGAP
jgi:prepilin-type N-terminal cleavage/methylation domain-containing protein